MRWLGVVALVACGPTSDPSGTGASTSSDPSTIGTTPTPTTSTPTTPSSPETFADEALVRALIAGDAELGVVLQDVAWSGGWPVHTAADTWLFVREDDGGNWSIAGDFDGWTPEPANRGEGFWWAEVAVPEPVGAGYKWVSGPTWTADLWARAYTFDANGRLSFVRPPGDRWHLERWPAVAGVGLAPRDLDVYVPAGTGPWPVLYAQDGQNLFDPEAIWGGWRLQEALADQPPMLVVGISNTADRFDEYTHVPDEIYGFQTGGRGDAYAALIGDVVRPHVEATWGSTGVDGLLGSSLGGLISLYVGVVQPGAWDFAGSMSGTLGWGRFVLENPAIETLTVAAGPDAVIYVDSGGSTGPDGLCRDPDGDGFPEDDPDSSDNYCVTRQYADALAASGWTWDQDLVHWHEPDALHNELAWAARVDLPLTVFSDLF